MWKILNPKHQISPYRACGVVGRAHGNKSKYLNSKQTFLKKVLPKNASQFLSFGFWYLIKPLQGLRGRGAEPHMFSISILEFRI